MSRITAVLLLGFAFTSAARLHSQATSVADRSAALNTLFKDVWEDDLKRSPEFASAIGDRRYNDQLNDLSPSAFNDEVARRRVFLTRLLTIDTAGLPEPQRSLAETLQGQLSEDETAARMKAWEMPVTAQQGIQTRLPAEVADWPFATVKDYDDYIARLHSIPMELRQASENLLAGINDNRAPAAATVTRAAAETEAIASQKAEASPFAAPLARFPAGIDAANRRRITADLLAAISSDVLPAYTRFAKFLRVAVLPAAGASDPALPPPGYGARERQILALRESAQAALGPRFDLDGFHRIVADSGALPVAAIEHQVNQWVGLRMAAK